MRKLLVPAVLTVALIGAACSGDSTDETTTTVASSTTAATTTTASGTPGVAEAVSIVNFSFNPGDLIVPVGTTVEWTNNGGTSHTSSSDDDVWDSGVLGPGGSFEAVFEAPGVFAYHCNIHASMTATVTVEG